MEMYADVDARAGVLEPEGIVEIKMRRDKLLGLMERLDETLCFPQTRQQGRRQDPRRARCC